MNQKHISQWWFKKYVWILFILLKIENNKKVTVWVLVTIHMSDCMNSATSIGLKKKEAKNIDLENADAKSKQSLNIKINFYLQ